jgi:hypothetical protein
VQFLFVGSYLESHNKIRFAAVITRAPTAPVPSEKSLRPDDVIASGNCIHETEAETQEPEILCFGEGIRVPEIKVLRVESDEIVFQ